MYTLIAHYLKGLYLVFIALFNHALSYLNRTYILDTFCKLRTEETVCNMFGLEPATDQGRAERLDRRRLP